jgi:hypothetical protein
LDCIRDFSQTLPDREISNFSGPTIYYLDFGGTTRHATTSKHENHHPPHLTTTAATLATAPATLWHFHLFAPAGLLTNLIAIPIIAWGAVPMGLVSMACLPFSTPLADF